MSGADRLPDSDRPPEPAEEHPERPAPPPAGQDDVFPGGQELSSGTAAAVLSGAMPPGTPLADSEPDPRSGPETMPSGAEPGDAERR